MYRRQRHLPLHRGNEAVEVKNLAIALRGALWAAYKLLAPCSLR